MNNELKALKCVRDIVNLKQENMVALEVTVPTGLEDVAANEIKAKAHNRIGSMCVFPGRVYFSVPINLYEDIRDLLCIDNINQMVGLILGIKFENDKSTDLKKLVMIANDINLRAAMKQWIQITAFSGNTYSTEKLHDTQKKSEIENNSGGTDDADRIIRYRVTCERSGEHSFSSTDAATVFGGHINDIHHWIVDLTNWDLNIYLRIYQDYVMICNKITTRSLHRRSLVRFGSTALRPTIAHGMLSLAKLTNGEVLLDPLCGGGSIAVECLRGYPQVIMLCGDIHSKSIEITKENVEAFSSMPCPSEIIQWDSRNLPFKNHQINAIVTDLPFGRRCGNVKANQELYPNLFKEFVRVLEPESGRLVVLSRDVNNLYKALEYKKRRSPWLIQRILHVNVGNLDCTLIVANLRMNGASSPQKA